MTLTPWFCAVTQPPMPDRPGDYEYLFCDVPTPILLLWSGGLWMNDDYCVIQPEAGDRWRGLLGDERGPFEEK
jgi:hypothetical protein